MAGPMTGLPGYNFPAFFEAESRLLAAGFDVLNPARHGAGEDGMEWADYMRRDLPDVLAVEGIALLPGWQKSRGARLEVHIASELGVSAGSVDYWLSEGVA